MRGHRTIRAGAGQRKILAVLDVLFEGETEPRRILLRYLSFSAQKSTQ